MYTIDSEENEEKFCFKEEINHLNATIKALKSVLISVILLNSLLIFKLYQINHLFAFTILEVPFIILICIFFALNMFVSLDNFYLFIELLDITEIDFMYKNFHTIMAVSFLVAYFFIIIFILSH